MEFYSSKLREVIKEKGYSRQYITNKLKIGRSTLYFWENGLRTPSRENLNKLADCLKINTGEISDIKISSINNNEDNSFKWMSFKKENSSFLPIECFIKSLKNRYNQIYSIIKMLSTSNIGIYIKSNSLNYITANNKYLEFINMPLDYNIYMKSDKDLFYNSDAASNTKEDREVIKYGKEVINKESFIPGTKKKKWGLISKYQLIGPETGEVDGMFCVIVDISEQRKNKIIDSLLRNYINEKNIGISITREKKLKSIFINEWLKKLFIKLNVDFSVQMTYRERINALADEKYHEILLNIYKQKQWNKSIEFPIKNLSSGRLRLNIIKKETNNIPFLIENYTFL